MEVVEIRSRQETKYCRKCGTALDCPEAYVSLYFGGILVSDRYFGSPLDRHVRSGKKEAAVLAGRNPLSRVRHDDFTLSRLVVCVFQGNLYADRLEAKSRNPRDPRPVVPSGVRNSEAIFRRKSRP
jgi:hypothetical protein